MRLCQSQALSKRAELWGAILALQAFWPGHLGIDSLDVVRSVGRLLDHGCFFKPLPQGKDDDLIAIVLNMILVQGPDKVKVTKLKGHATEAYVEQGPGWRIGLGILKLIVLPTWEGVTSLRRLWVLGGPCLTPWSRGITGSWLLFHRSRLIMLGGVVRPLILLFRIRGVASSSAGLTLGLMLILLCFPSLLVS